MSMVRNDPYRTFNFRLEIDGVEAAAFSEATGLTSDGDVVDYRTGMDQLLTNRKLPGLRRYGPITLKRGMTKDGTLWDWYSTVATGTTERYDGSVILRDEAGVDVLRWNFRSAWPNKIEGPSLRASGNEVAIESVELIVEEITLEVA
jgi:phage tail-like protein